MRRHAARGWAALWSLAAFGVVACGPSGPPTYEVRGLVHSADAESRDVVIEHEDIEGLMPAMTMNFDVADASLFAHLAAGNVVEFTLEVGPRGYLITDVRATGETRVPEGFVALGNALHRTDPMPDFQLVDHTAKPLGSADLRGKTLLVDFIFTRCPGPCPILTGILRDVQAALPEAVAEDVRIVSISLDPEYDTPVVLADYALKRGAGLETWSFLTGAPERVDDVLKRFGVARVRTPDGDIEHLSAIFLVDAEGRIVRRYTGLDHKPEDLVRDVVELARASG
ncbi:MAG: SCO family protein [Proteobacteria bacterium]|nr:SCO family protein [Pseudomonadota bacterium]